MVRVSVISCMALLTSMTHMAVSIKSIRIIAVSMSKAALEGPRFLEDNR